MHTCINISRRLKYASRWTLVYIRRKSHKAIVRLTNPKRKTLGEKGIECIFVGYVEHSKAYMFYVIESKDFISINSIIESKDAILNENRFSSIPRTNDIIPNFDECQRDDHSVDVPSETPEPRRGKRARKAKSYGYDFQLYLVEGSRDQIGSQYSYWYSIEADLRTYNKAMQSRDDAFWKEAIDDEIGSIMENNTWVLSDLPPEEEEYMKKPEGFVMPGDEHKVCKLVKSFKFDDSDKGVIICLYVDDMLIFGTDQNQVDKTKKFLSSRFSMKDMAEADVILDCSPVNTPMDLVEELKSNTGTMNYDLSYVGCPSVLKAYSDANWINHVEDSSSTSGWVFLLGGGAISWASNKQTYITGYTMKSEFVALADAGKEAE
nr:zinc finger, CCHC-type [Tanacetum cinerariifolium]